MKKLNGSKKLKTSVFISGTGSNLKKLINFSFKKNSPINIVLVVSSNKYAKGLIFSKKWKIDSKIYLYKNKIKSENKILKDLKKKKVELICLAGFMKILSKNFIKKFKGKILNIHPSLLPKYKGLNTHKKVIENNEKFSGCTVHLVNSKLDSGKIILQKKIRISKKDNYKTLKKKNFKTRTSFISKGYQKIYF